MSSPESKNGFELTKLTSDEIGTTYLGKKNGDVIFDLSFNHPDAFHLAWRTNLDLDRFLDKACQLSDAVAEMQPEPRPVDTNDSTVVAHIKMPSAGTTASGRIRISGSYSDFGYNNVHVGSLKGHADLRFENTGWPLTREALQKAIYENPTKRDDKFEISDGDFIRINCEFCTLYFNALTPGIFTYSSHIPAILPIAKIYRETSVAPELIDEVANAVNTLASPQFAKYLPKAS